MSDERAAKDRARLAGLVEPATTAVLTMELQRGVVGPNAMLQELVAQVEKAGTVRNAAAVCEGARNVGSRVVHCTAVSRADGAGGAVNCRIFAMGDKLRQQQGYSANEIGRDGALLVEELGPDPRDIEVARLHGMTPFTSTSLNQILRNLGVTTVVVTGASVNLGIFGMCLGALDHGYQVVLVRDAVAGVPAEYADAVIDNSLSLIATVTTSEELLSIWAGHSS